MIFEKLFQDDFKSVIYWNCIKFSNKNDFKMILHEK